MPEEVHSYDDILNVVKQLRPLPNSPFLERYPPTSSNLTGKVHALSYFLGVMVGDMSKSPIQRRAYSTMRVMLQLSKRRLSNLRFGNYVARCAALIGLRMKRIDDYIRPEPWPYDAYRWESQNSELLMWMFEACLGMTFDKTTTDDPIKADWLKYAPPSFQKSFLQGLSDSDGYVDINKHEVGVVVDPNEFLIGEMLQKLRVEFRSRIAKGQANVIMGVKQAYSLPIFSPVVHGHKFDLTEKLSNAHRLWGPWPAWLRREVDQLLSSGNSPSEVVLTILNRHNIAIRSQHLRRRDL